MVKGQLGFSWFIGYAWDVIFRFVWRVRKANLQNKTTGVEDLQRQIQYLDKTILPLRHAKRFVPRPALVYIDGKYLSDALTEAGINSFKISSDLVYVGLEMKDVCFLSVPPEIIDSSSNISVEMKLKMGSPQGTNHINRNYCGGCLIQIHKWLKDPNYKPYDYCPTDIFSGNPDRMVKAVRNLLANPHKHLIVRKGGQVIFDTNHLLSELELLEILFPDSHHLRTGFLELLCRTLTAQLSSESSNAYIRIKWFFRLIAVVSFSFRFLLHFCHWCSWRLRTKISSWRVQFGDQRDSLDKWSLSAIISWFRRLQQWFGTFCCQDYFCWLFGCGQFFADYVRVFEEAGSRDQCDLQLWGKEFCVWRKSSRFWPQVIWENSRLFSPRPAGITLPFWKQRNLSCQIAMQTRLI